ncbi:MAG: IS66 family transposase [Ktedonobacterales bacterium]
MTHYAIHAKRSSEATSANGILPDYRGESVHDGWKPYQAHTCCRHALCNVHHLRDTLVARYEHLLALGLAANPPPQRRSRQRGRMMQSPVRNLLERLWLGQAQVLAFLDDPAIPFDNNQATCPRCASRVGHSLPHSKRSLPIARSILPSPDQLRLTHAKLLLSL